MRHATMMPRTKVTHIRLALVVSLWVFCIVSIVLDLSHVIAPRGHDFVSLFVHFYLLWQWGQWVGAISLPFYMAVIVARHKQGL